MKDLKKHLVYIKRKLDFASFYLASHIREKKKYQHSNLFIFLITAKLPPKKIFVWKRWFMLGL